MKDLVLSRFDMKDCAPRDMPIAKGDKFHLLQCPRNEIENKEMENIPYASAITTRKKPFIDSNKMGYAISSSGYVFMLAKEVVSWKSVKQSLIATSTMEVEFTACYEASNQAMWLRNFIIELCVVDGIERPLRINCDNKAIELYSKNNKSLSKSKHIDLKFRLLRRDINFMIADPLTKGVPPKVFHEHVAHMCVVNLGDTYV
ncbi:hypothetical protein AAG906_016797 [Vitis piasezkii]